MRNAANMFPPIHVVFKKCQNKPGAKMGTCEEINKLLFSLAWSMAIEFTTTTEAIASKNYWPLQDMKQLASTKYGLFLFE